MNARLPILLIGAAALSACALNRAEVRPTSAVAAAEIQTPARMAEITAALEASRRGSANVAPPPTSSAPPNLDIIEQARILETELQAGNGRLRRLTE